MKSNKLNIFIITLFVGILTCGFPSSHLLGNETGTDLHSGQWSDTPSPLLSLEGFPGFNALPEGLPFGPTAGRYTRFGTTAFNHTVDAGDDLVACPDGETTLSATASGGTPPYTFTWYADAGLTQVVGTGQSISLTISGPWTYYVEAVDATGAGSVDDLSVTVEVPTVAILPECDPEGIFYILHVITDSGDNTISTSTGSPVLIGPGEWKVINILQADSVTVTVISGAGCTNTQEVEPPDCNECALMVMVKDTSICQGGSAELTAHVGWGFPPYTYEWSDTPDFSNTLGTQESLTVNTPGTYYLKAAFSIDTDPNSPDDELITCEAVDTVEVGLLEPPSITVDSVFCADDNLTYSVELTAEGATDFSASAGTVDASNAPQYVIEDIPVGEDLTVAASNICGERERDIPSPDCCTLTVEVMDAEICPGDTATLTAMVSGSYTGNLAYEWSNGEITESIMVSPAVTTAYGVTVTADGPGICVDSTMATVTVKPLPTVSIDSVFCAADSLSYSAVVTITEADAVSANSGTIPGSPSGNATFTITDIDLDSTLLVTASNECGEDSDEIQPPICVECTLLVDVLDVEICPGDTATLTAMVSGSYTGNLAYEWSNGEITQSIMVNPAVTTAYGVTVTADGPGTCVDSTMATVTVKPLPTVSIDSVFCAADSLSYSAVVTITEADAVSANSGTIPGSPSGNATFTITDIDLDSTLLVTASNECGEDSDEIQPPICEECTLMVDVLDVEICPGDTATLTAMVSGSYTGNLAYEWSNGEITESIMVNPAVTTAYGVTVTADGPGTCVDSTMATVTVKPLPTVSIDSVFCAADSLSYSAVVTITEADAVSANSGTIPGSPSGNATFTITDIDLDSTLLVTASNECGEDSDEIQPPICEECTLMVDVLDVEICPGDTATLTAMPSGGYDLPLAYLWSTGDTTQSIMVNPAVTTAYGVTVTADGPGLCVDSTMATVTVKPLPAFVNLTTVCEADTAYTLVFQTTNADSSVVSTASLDSLFLGNGPHTLMGLDLMDNSVTVTAFNMCGDSTITVTPPNCDTCTLMVDVLDVEICPGDTATLTAMPSGGYDLPLAYLWSTGDTTQSIMVNPAVTTAYGVTVTADGPGLCVDSTMATVTVKPLPAFVNLTTVCEADTAYTLVFQTTNADSSVVSTASLDSLFLGNGPHTLMGLDLMDNSVTVTAFNMCGDSTITVTPPNCDTCTLMVDVLDVEICPGDTATLTAMPSGGYDLPLAYLWSTGDTTQSIMVNPAVTTAYGVTVTADGPGTCVDSTMATVTVKPLPAFVNLTTVCEADTAYTLVFQTTNADSSVVSTASLDSLFLGNGPHTLMGLDLMDNSVTVTAFNMCGDSTITVTPPNCDTCTLMVDVLDVEICPGDTATLTAMPSGGYDLPLAYLWSTGDTTQSIMVNPAVTTAYGVTVTADGPGLCVDSTMATVTVKPLPAFVNLTTVCEADTAYTLVFQTTNADSSVVSTASLDSLFLGNGPHTLMGLDLMDNSVTVTAFNMCGDSTITVTPPNCDTCTLMVDVLDVEICPGDTATLTAMPSGGYDLPLAYLWSTGDTTQSIMVNPAVTTAYGVTVTADGPGTCVDSTMATVTVKPLPAFVNLTTVCEADTAYTLVFQTTNADSSVVSTASLDSLFLGNGPHTLMGLDLMDNSVTVTAFNMCGDSTITVTPPNCDTCTLMVDVLDVEICPGDTATLTAMPSGGYDLPLAYLWSTGDTTQSIMVNPAVTTAYGVTVTADGPGLCVDSTMATVTVKPLPAFVNLTTVCEADTAYTLVFQTTNADSSVVSTASLDSLFLGNGPHTLMGLDLMDNSVTVTAFNMCGDSTITVTPPNCDTCTLMVDVLDVEICPGDTATLTAMPSGGYDLPLAYLWSTGDTTQSIMVNPAVTTAYGVTVTADGPGTCVDSTMATVTVKPLPAFVNLTTVCEADTAYTLVFQTTNADSSVVSTASLDSLFLGNGPHTLMGLDLMDNSVTVTAFNMCGDSTITVTPPNCDTCTLMVDVLDVEICPGDTATLTAMPSGGYDLPLAYLWSTGDTTQSIMVNPAVTTAYGVTVTADGPGTCVDSTMATVTVKPLPAFVNLTTVCEADTAYTLVFQTTNADSSVVSTASLDSLFLGNGPHTLMGLDLMDNSVTVTAFNMCGDSTITVTPPNCDTCTLMVDVLDVEICPGDTATLTAMPSGAYTGNLAYLWSTGEVTQSIMVNPAVTTAYGVTVTADGPGLCVDSTMATVTVQPLPMVMIDSVYCSEDSLVVFVELTATNIDTIITSAGVIEPHSDPDGYLVTIPAGMVDQVSIIGSNNCGADNKMVPLPSCSECDLDATVTGDTICPGELADLIVVVSGGSGDFSTLWFDNENCDGDTLSTTSTLSISPDVTTTYYVLVIDNMIDSCQIKLPATVIVDPLPTITVVSNECDPNSDNYILVITVTDTDTVTTSAGSIVATNDSTYIVTIPNNLSATITATNNCGDDMVNVDPPVVCLEAIDILATADGLENGTTIHIDQTVDLDVIVDDCNDCTFNWTGIPSIITPDLQSPVFDPDPNTQSGIYTFTVEVNRDADCCPPVQDTVSVCVIPICEAAIFVPNAFTPNGDGSNDEFRVLATDVDELLLVIYDRWGEKITELRSTRESWDGTYRGEPLPSDVYGYYMEARCINGEEFFKKGNITLLK